MTTTVIFSVFNVINKWQLTSTLNNKQLLLLSVPAAPDVDRWWIYSCGVSLFLGVREEKRPAERLWAEALAALEWFWLPMTKELHHTFGWDCMQAKPHLWLHILIWSRVGNAVISPLGRINPRANRRHFWLQSCQHQRAEQAAGAERGSAITHAKRLSGYDVSMEAAMFSAVTMSERKTDGFVTAAGDHQSSLLGCCERRSLFFHSS